jgi:hypothetical protein
MKSFIRFAVGLMAMAVMLVCASGASADTFSFSITGGYTASGTLSTGAKSAAGTYTITGISGVQNLQSITSLLGINDFASNTNLLYASGPLLDLGGFSFVAGGTDYNVYYNDGTVLGPPVGYGEIVAPQSTGLGPQIQFSVVQTPEPSSLLLIGLGLFGLIVVARSKVVGAAVV